MDYLKAIVARKRVEVLRRRSHRKWLDRCLSNVSGDSDRGMHALEVFRGSAVEEAVFDGSSGSHGKKVQGPVKLIAEVKFRSPSAGLIRPREVAGAQRLAQAYVDGGASAVSVLADAPGFGGSVLDVRRVTRTVSVPVLFKEFVVDPIQVDVAHLAGASMVLLLANVLDDREIEQLAQRCFERGLAPLLEVANGEELHRANHGPCDLVGINARDLHSFHVDWLGALSLCSKVTDAKLPVLMSGIRQSQQLHQARDVGARAVLVGESLARSPDPGSAVRALLDAHPTD